MLRQPLAILLAIAFALQTLLAVTGAACECCGGEFVQSEAVQETDSCCDAQTAPEGREDHAPPDPSDNGEHKCPMSCCAVSVPAAFIAGTARVFDIPEPNFRVDETPSNYHAPTGTGLKRPPRARTIA